MNPRKDQTSFTFVGVGHSAIPDNLVGSMAISPGRSMSPRKSTSFTPNLHFFNFKWRFNSFILCRTLFVHSVFSFSLVAVMSMSSM